MEIRLVNTNSCDVRVNRSCTGQIALLTRTKYGTPLHSSAFSTVKNNYYLITHAQIDVLHLGVSRITQHSNHIKIKNMIKRIAW